MIHPINWFLHAIGVLPRQTSTAYNFWSGFGSDLTYLGAVAGLLHHVNCHAKGCWRIGRHEVDGTPFKVCRKHHPTIPNKGASVEEIHAAHEAANG